MIFSTSYFVTSHYKKILALYNDEGKIYIVAEKKSNNGETAIKLQPIMATAQKLNLKITDAIEKYFSVYGYEDKKIQHIIKQHFTSTTNTEEDQTNAMAIIIQTAIDQFFTGRHDQLEAIHNIARYMDDENKNSNIGQIIQKYINAQTIKEKLDILHEKAPKQVVEIFIPIDCDIIKMPLGQNEIKQISDLLVQLYDEMSPIFQENTFGEREYYQSCNTINSEEYTTAIRFNDAIAADVIMESITLDIDQAISKNKPITEEQLSQNDINKIKALLNNIQTIDKLCISKPQNPVKQLTEAKLTQLQGKIEETIDTINTKINQCLYDSITQNMQSTINQNSQTQNTQTINETSNETPNETLEQSEANRLSEQIARTI